MRLKLRIIVFCGISFFSNENKSFIYLFIYLFVYTFRLFSRNLIRAKFKGLGDSQNQVLAILKTFSTHKGQMLLRHIRIWRTLLMPCLTSCTIPKRRICNISHKFIIKVKRFSASKKSGAIMYK